MEGEFEMFTGMWMHLMQPQLCWAREKHFFTWRIYGRDQTSLWKSILFFYGEHPTHNKTQANHFPWLKSLWSPHSFSVPVFSFSFPLSFLLSFSKCSVCNTKNIKYIKLSVEYRELMCNFLIFKMTATNSKQNYYSTRTLKCIFSGISGKFLSERIKPIINSRTFDYFPFLNHWWICLRKPPRCCSKPCKLFTENNPFQMTAWAQFPRAAGHNRGWL